MTTTEQPVPPPVLLAIRDPRMRRVSADRVFAELWGSLDGHEARVAKVNELAETLDIERKVVRRALRVMAATGWLRFSHRDENGRGYYCLGERGASGPPVPA